MAVLFLLPAGLRAQALTIDFETADFSQHPFTQGASYPWIIVDASNGCDNGSSYCMKSGNTGVDNSSSSIQATHTFSNDGYIVFDAKCMGETSFDFCKFYIDGTVQFSKDIAAWNHYAFNVTAGTHTFKWEYTKDYMTSYNGDGFFVDNIEFGLGDPCFLASNLVAYGTTDGSATVSWQGNSNSYT